jgi:CRP-like cAMP-binding protein
MKLKSIYRSPGRIITVSGTIPDAMYMVRFGVVRIKGLAGYQERDLFTGELFGEMALMGLSSDGKRVRTSVALTVCELCVLTQLDFMDLLTNRPGFFNLIRKVSRMHLARLHDGIPFSHARLAPCARGWQH